MKLNKKALILTLKDMGIIIGIIIGILFLFYILPDLLYYVASAGLIVGIIAFIGYSIYQANLKEIQSQESESHIPIKDLICKKDYDKIEIIPLSEREGSIFVGCCKSDKGKLISLDGNAYSENMIVLSYKEWTTEHIKNGLTVIVRDF